MPSRIVSTSHRWIGAATYALDDQVARHAHSRHFVMVHPEERVRIDILEVYCAECHRPYDDVADEVCEAAASNEHLRGGPLGTRAKRGPRNNNDATGEDTDTLVAVAQ